jgi:NAD(P)-dependent dehydrogenase (short-subunit alcohol dehydrogenase family)
MPSKNYFDLTGRVVAVIGGTSGIGRELEVIF